LLPGEIFCVKQQVYNLYPQECLALKRQDNFQLSLWNFPAKFFVRVFNLKTNLTALIADHDKNIDQYLKVCKEIGVTHWIHLFTGNQIRSHFRKYGSPKIALISERI
jgi:hypothetical protein